MSIWWTCAVQMSIWWTCVIHMFTQMTTQMSIFWTCVVQMSIWWTCIIITVHSDVHQVSSQMSIWWTCVSSIRVEIWFEKSELRGTVASGWLIKKSSRNAFNLMQLLSFGLCCG
ncbi:MAG: hypothetical protein IPI60_05365 [Saprospiraceae bacterium]|nr:hypothetical protein [Saprospiraceae bacterium]